MNDENKLKEANGYKWTSRNKPEDITEELEYLKMSIDSDLVWDEIVEIKYLEDPKEYVYDFTIPNNENFMIYNGIMTHNTLNSVDWNEEIYYKKDDNIVVDNIGNIIDSELDNVNKNVVGGSKNKPFMTTEQTTYNYLTRTIADISRQLEFSKSDYNLKQRLKFLRLQRARFLGSCESKLKVAKELLMDLGKFDIWNRTLIFCNSIDSAKQICVYNYHSKSTDNSLDKFREGKINVLSCVNALNEGVNLSAVSNILILQANTSDLVMTQRIGRGLRLKANHLEKSKIYILCMQNTIDVDWVNNVTKNLNVI
jgi:hypothetical protein